MEETKKRTRNVRTKEERVAALDEKNCLSHQVVLPH